MVRSYNCNHSYSKDNTKRINMQYVHIRYHIPSSLPPLSSPQSLLTPLPHKQSALDPVPGTPSADHRPPPSYGEIRINPFSKLNGSSCQYYSFDLSHQYKLLMSYILARHQPADINPRRRACSIPYDSMPASLHPAPDKGCDFASDYVEDLQGNIGRGRKFVCYGRGGVEGIGVYRSQ